MELNDCLGVGGSMLSWIDRMEIEWMLDDGCTRMTHSKHLQLGTLPT